MSTSKLHVLAASLAALLAAHGLAPPVVSSKPEKRSKASVRSAAAVEMTPAPAAAPAAAPAPAPAADLDAVLQRMMDLGTPGPEHALLEPLAGSWSCEVRYSMTPDSPPDISTGRLMRKWIFGGRYLTEKYDGTAGGVPFQGAGLTAYDKGQGVYVGTWIDSMSTGVFHHVGSVDASGRLFTYHGEHHCPILDGMKKVRATLEVLDANRNVMRMYEPAPGGGERKGFEMDCKRD